MKDYSPAQILKAVKEASPFDLFLISFLLLPFVFNAWLGVLEKLQATPCQKVWSLAAVLIFYVIGLLAMLAGSTRIRRRETARDLILTYIQENKVTWMSFDSVRAQINASYSDRFLSSVVAEYPQQLRFASIKAKDSELRFVGVGRVIEEEAR